MQLNVKFIDAFTDQVFKGNPAAVIITEQWLGDELMQKIAAENNLSETAFVVSYDTNCYQIRWFSPLTEIDFCGHATLATAFVLFNEQTALKTLTFSAEAVGELAVKKLENGAIQMSFPNRKPHVVTDIPDDLIKGLSICPDEVYLNQQAYFAVYKNEQDVTRVIQDQICLKRLAPYDVVVTAKSSQYDFISRYFWPANGGDEDPVTGSIHAGLAPLWAERLGKSRLSAYQSSQRGGQLSCTVEGDRILISGKAVQYLEGTVHLSD